ncbi:SecDF P1 head subdomain-containing protein [Actinophytocola sp.]|uniref:SecDF P1 head subdomain-containing protein n=1 Tax=Actinophytocola sp. TaxID=1872138 RepID=UPI0039C884CF
MASAHAEVDGTGGGGWVVNISFRDDGARAWADFTTQNVGQQVAIVINAPLTREFDAPATESDAPATESYRRATWSEVTNDQLLAHQV